jgi:hypothetical protein
MNAELKAVIDGLTRRAGQRGGGRAVLAGHELVSADGPGRALR